MSRHPEAVFHASGSALSISAAQQKRYGQGSHTDNTIDVHDHRSQTQPVAQIGAGGAFSMPELPPGMTGRCCPPIIAGSRVRSMS